MADDASIPLGGFPETQWSLVFRAGGGDEVRREAMGELLGRYLPALKAHLVLRKRVDPDRANDLVQGFAADKVVERDLLGHVTGGKGKFRTFLLTAFDRYVISEFRRRTAKKRSPGRLMSLDDVDQEGPAPSDPFDVAWARELLREVLDRMRAECRATERPDIWDVFECRVLTPTLEDTKPVPYEQVVRRFGFRSPSHASHVLETAKRMFARLLRSAVEEYVGEAGDVEAEIGELREILSRPSP